MLKQLRCCRSEEVKLWGQGMPQCAAYGRVRLHALQMLAGGDVQKERLTAMRERIMQRTIPIEEVCYICHSHLMGGDSSAPNALLMRCSVKINMYKLCMCAASGLTTVRAPRKPLVCQVCRLNQMAGRASHSQAARQLQDACSRVGLPGSCGKLARHEGGMGAPCRCGRRCSTARSACSCCARSRVRWRRTSASCRMSCARQAPFHT